MDLLECFEPVDPVEENLPEQVVALSQARRSHSDYMAHLTGILNELETKFAKAKANHERKVLQENELYSKLCGLKTERMRRQQNVANIEKELTRLFAEMNDLETRLRIQEKEAKQRKRTIEEYNAKMREHQGKVQQAREKIPAMLELACLKKEIQNMEQNKRDTQENIDKLLLELCESQAEGSTEQAAHDVIRKIEMALDQRRADLETMEHEVEVLQEESEKVETANKILVNRNAARLRKLKRQVEDQRSKRLEMTSAIEALNERIYSVREKLDKMKVSETDDQQGQV